ncbi:hypothetical protein BG011_008971 [Mortierella polycephala]|uniref:Uncharacterized protein n=1 Tax=Mortierella polycephala TaxID=41804 RepID=A0A9P6PPL6_9FUNG|nr:hypothetical protein BG011_008971 [Mortierella polycephala]
MDNSAGTHGQGNDASENTSNQPQDDLSMTSADSSEWETESSNDGGDDLDVSEESFDDDDDEFMDEEEFGGVFLDDHDGEIDIETLTPATRANRRPNMEDIWSEFSGDEKYEPRVNISDNDGQGDNDMVDRNIEERFMFTALDEMQLTHKIRHLMLNLTRGRIEREKKLRIGAWRNDVSTSLSASSSSSTESSSSSPSSVNGPYLHRLVVRGSEHPKEVEHSPAITFHHQCANSLVVTPSSMGLWDDIFTISADAIMRGGVLERMTEKFYHKRLNAAVGEDDQYNDMATESVYRPYAGELKTVKATKFLKTSFYRFDQLPPSDDYVVLEDGDDPLCLAHKYGYLAHGTNDGKLIVYCTQCGEEPLEIYSDILSDDPNMMINSLQLVRWPRYYRSRMAQEQDPQCPTDESVEELFDGEDDYDEEDGYPTKTGQFDHYLVITGNDKGLYVIGLPDHVDSHGRFSSDFDDHRFKYKESHTWIRHGFEGEALNDAKVSPNDRWIAVVGDSAKVWIIEVTHVPETEDQRILREEQELLLGLETDSDEYMSDSTLSPNDSMAEAEVKLNIADEPKGSRGEKRSRSDDHVLSDRDNTSFKNARSKCMPRLLHQFGDPQEMLIPNKVLYPPKSSKGRRQQRNMRPANAEPYSSQYVSWNATSTKFVHSSDVSSRVLVWSMPAREIVCCVDTGGASFGIEFHPKLENLFAVCNWYGFVHIVDVTGCCVGDEDLIPGDSHYNGQTERGPGLTGCEGPHYEEKHDILMLSFRGEKDKSLRILDALRGLGWSTDGQHLYVATLRRVLRFELSDDRIRIPRLFELCARKVREWKERGYNQRFTYESPKKIRKAFKPIPDEWQYVPYYLKRRIWGDHYLMRSHDG